MNPQLYLVLFLLTFGAVGTAQSNLFQVSLTAESVRADSPGSHWLRAVLKQPPVISDADLVRVDLTNHMMEVKAGVFERLPKPSVHGTQFVLVAGGERVFLGLFWTGLSSSSTTAPTILVDHIPGKNYLRFQWIEDLKNDPWSDPRIRRSLEKLHKLGHVDFP